MDSKPKVSFVLGGPGAGKGTACANLAKNEGYIHLSAGDLLREERNSGSETATLINDYIKEGKIVPSEITINLLKKAMERNGWEKSKFLVDGFPRNKENLEGWEKIFDSSAEVVCCLFFDCSFEAMEKRILKRGESSGRVDDNAEAIKKRFDTYIKETKPIIDEFGNRGKLVLINSEESPEKVYESASQELKTRMN